MCGVSEDVVVILAHLLMLKNAGYNPWLASCTWWQCSDNTGRFFRRRDERRMCQGVYRQMQALCGIKRSCSTSRETRDVSFIHAFRVFLNVS